MPFALGHHDELPEGVLISVQEVSKAPPLPMPMPPKWLARILPGVEWSAADDGGDPEDDEDDDMDDFDVEERPGVAFKEFSFDVSAGQGLGLVGPDFQVTQTLLLMITGYQPPSAGRILVRGRVAPLLKAPALNVSRQQGKKAIAITARVLGWPPDMLKGRKWDEIVKFARLEEIEYPEGSLEHGVFTTKRLIQSAALHLDDATVYLVGHNFAKTDPPFAERCYEVLERRQQDGCAFIQNGVQVEEVSRLCHEAIYVDNGAPMLRGRLGEVASFALQHEAGKEKHGVKALPVRALLLGEGVEIGTRGGKIEVELDVFKKELELELAMLFVDELGRETRVEQPQTFVASDPGIYRLTVNVPGGLLGYSSYQAKLLAAGEDGAADEHELLSFNFVSHGAAGSGPDPEPPLDLVGASGDTGTGDETGNVEWNVHRAGA